MQAAGDAWQQSDPYWHGREAIKIFFNADGSTRWGSSSLIFEDIELTCDIPSTSSWSAKIVLCQMFLLSRYFPCTSGGDGVIRTAVCQVAGNQASACAQQSTDVTFPRT